ncbi:hypothetical protein BLNAU_17986 [Blattamonas nauphoetae]|uniref:Uncharacterized protein n=1 Tax=Blattamonas nauphoetae TaxID=2049346 RepID=A0ABQ9X5L5_9EUKA|nr:hypothetical protein BLNAU_17986 [Blattamonas nauphoetae]
MKMLARLIWNISAKRRLALVNADLIPQLIVTLNPQSLSLVESIDIHIHLMNITRFSLWLATPNVLKQLEIEDHNTQQAVQETVLQQVVVPSEQYIGHLCVNRYSIMDGDISYSFLMLLAQLLKICPYYQPSMDFVHHMPIFLTIPSCLTFFENDRSIRNLMYDRNHTQREWNINRGEYRQIWKEVYRMLRMEGIEDVFEEKLRNDKNGSNGRDIVDRSIDWNNELGMNVPEQE